VSTDECQQRINSLPPHVEQRLSLELVEAGVEEAQGGEAFEKPLVVDQSQHASDHRGGCLQVKEQGWRNS